MTTPLSPVAQLHADCDQLVAALKANPDKTNFRSCCSEGCFACCYEAVFCDQHEAAAILEAITEEGRETLKILLSQWLARLEYDRLDQIPYEGHNIGIRYRLAHIKCPLLKDGRCSVYANRPSACRMFFAIGNPKNCDMPARNHQKFAIMDAIPANRQMIANYGIAVRELTIDHLCVHLYNQLFGANIRTAAAQQFEVEETLPA